MGITDYRLQTSIQGTNNIIRNKGVTIQSPGEECEDGGFATDARFYYMFIYYSTEINYPFHTEPAKNYLLQKNSHPLHLEIK